MALHKEDKSAAFIGLVATAALLFLMSLVIVKLTNAHFAGEHATAEATK
jgi:hypothetical protein